MGRPRAQMIEKKRFEPLAKAVLRTQPDARLVALVRKGSEPAFDEIVRRYRPALVPFAAAYASSASAEDVVQESLIRAWDAIRDSDPDVELALKPWLFTIVRIPKRDGGRIMFGVDPGTDKTTRIGVPNIPICE